MIRSSPLIAVMSVFLAISGIAESADQKDISVMNGFQVNYSQVGSRALRRMESSLERQFQIVEEAQLPVAVLEFFRTVPVFIVSELPAGFGRARVDAGQQIVELKAADLPRDRPILLHELLHAYHGQKLGPTPIIRDSYQHAKQSNIYPKRYADAHFLSNPREYFAVIGSIYLYGKKIDQPPYDCEVPAKHQPEFIAFLAQQFGQRECK
jgi:hypothetical protein